MNLFKRKRRRIIEFPPGTRLGRLYAVEAQGYKFFAQAEGTVVVPQGVLLTLRVDAGVATLAPLQALNPQDLHGLSIAHTGLDDDSLHDVSALHDLRALHLDHSRTTGRGLRWLSHLNTYYLSARFTDFSDEGASALAKMKLLEVVDLSTTDVTDSSISYLAELPSLKSLAVWENPITSKAGDSLRHIESLRELHLGGTRFGDEGIERICDLPELAILRLERTPVTDRSLRLLVGASRLTELSVSDTAITDAGIESLADFSTLRVLTLANTAVTGHSLMFIQRLSALEKLDLANTDIGDQAVAVLAQMPTLTTLILTGTRVTPSAVSLLKEQRPHLNLIWAPPVTMVPTQLHGVPLSLPGQPSNPAGPSSVDNLLAPTAAVSANR